MGGENSTVGREPLVFTAGHQLLTPTLTAPAAEVSQLRPQVTWAAVAGATQYEVWIRNQSTGETRLIVEPVSGTSFTPSLRHKFFAIWMSLVRA